MAISKDSGISAADVNAVINSVQATYKKYGFSGTASTVSNGAVASAAAINMAISKLNSSISKSANRRFYYYKGSVVGTVSSGTLLSASMMTTLNTTNTQVSNDYCNCDSNCRCDYNCCYYDCSCDSDCCNGDCSCDPDVNIGCCFRDCGHGYCSNDCNCDIDCFCNVEGCRSDCCDSNCSCNSNCCDYDCCNSDY